MADRDQDTPIDEGRRNSDIREETNLRDALGDLKIGNETEKVTPQNDVFADDDKPKKESAADKR